jgi:hypothetical protein
VCREQHLPQFRLGLGAAGAGGFGLRFGDGAVLRGWLEALLTLGKGADALRVEIAFPPDLDELFVGKNAAVHDEDLLLIAGDERAASEELPEVGGLDGGVNKAVTELRFEVVHRASQESRMQAERPSRSWGAER